MKSKHGSTNGFRLENFIEAFNNCNKEELKQNPPDLYYSLLDIQDGIKSKQIKEDKN